MPRPTPLILLLALVMTSLSFAQATKPSTRPASRPTTRSAAAPSAELLALWKELDPEREAALALARKVEKGETLEKARANRTRLIDRTKRLNELLAPIAAVSPLRYGASPRPTSGIGKAIWFYKASRSIEAYNAAHKSEMSVDEYGIFLLTNQYREALGALPVEYDIRLRDAARGHTAWMRENNVFDHDVDRPGHKTPDQRVTQEGYTWNSVGENIAQGQRNALEAFTGWFDSPGHHHTLVGDYVHLGVGLSGDYWCQNFAKGQPPKATSK